MGDIYYDEEECLGFDLFVAELELIAGNRRGRPDAVQLMQSLQKLVATVGRTDRSMLKQHQPRCEALLTDLLNLGFGTAVRYLIFTCMSKLYTYGDMISIYSRVSGLQSALTAKDAANRPEVVRLGLLECLAYLSLHHGRLLASAAAESVSIASRVAASRYTSLPVRLAALQLAASVVEGINPLDRSAPVCQTDAYALFKASCKDRTSDEARTAALLVLTAIARCGGAVLWRDGAYYWDEALKIAVISLDDTSQAVRDAAGVALGEMAAALRGPQLLDAISSEKKPARKELLSRLATPLGVRSCLLQPMADAALTGRRHAVAASACGWLAFCTALQQGAATPSEATEALLEVAQSAVSMCDAAGRALGGSLGGSADAGPASELLGAAASGGELPLATSAAAYVMRCGIVEALPEPGQRALLQRLTVTLARCHGGGAAVGLLSVPAQAAVLEVVRALLETLSEVDLEAGSSLQAAVEVLASSSPSRVVRHAAATALAALAVAMPMSAAQLLGDMLNGVDSGCCQLATSIAAPPVGPGQRSVQVLMDAVHGYALAAASLLAASPRLPLGLPSSLHAQVQQLAERCIAQPLCAASLVSCAVERSAGYMLLGSLMACSHVDDVAQAASSWLVLLQVALGHGCHKEALLDEHVFSPARPGADAELAAQLGWRCMALQALGVYLGHVLARGLASDPLRQIAVVAEMLTPLLDTVTATNWLQEPRLARNGPGSALAATAAVLQLRLLEVCSALPLAARVLLPAHGALIKIGLTALRGAGAVASGGPSALTPGVADALLSSCLRVLLSKDDTPLGPWTPGRDALQDELMHFVGERGGPLPPPWHSAAAANSDSASMAMAAGGCCAAGAMALSATPSPSCLLSGSSNGNGSSSLAGALAVEDAALLSAMTDCFESKRRSAPFLPAQGMGCALQEAQLLLLGKLLACISQPNQLKVLEVLLKACTAGRGLPRKDASATARRMATSTCVAIAALSGLGPLARRMKAAADSTDQVPEKVLALAYALLDDQLDHPALVRAGAELIGVAAGLGTDAFAVRLLWQLAADVNSGLSENQSPLRRAAYCLALGCAHRIKGGLALAAAIPVTVEALVATASRPVSGQHLWALHGLWLLADAAGLAFNKSVRTTLQLCLELTASSADGPQLRSAVARLANAMVAVLGPELTLGSTAYDQAKSLIVLNADVSGSGSSTAVDSNSTSNSNSGAMLPSSLAGSTPTSSDTPSESLQAVLFAQQLIIFSPRAVPAGKHVPMLRHALLSRRPGLRRAAAATLRHLAERDAASILPERLEPVLFLALDSEMDAGITAQLKATISTLLAAGAPMSPAYWLAVLGEVAFASSPGAGTGAIAQALSEGPAGGDFGGTHGDDEERGGAGGAANGQSSSVLRIGGKGYTRSAGVVSGAAATAAAALAYLPETASPEAAAAALAAQAAGGLDTATLKTLQALATPRLRTRLFAANCVLAMLAALHDSASAASSVPGVGSSAWGSTSPAAAVAIAPPPPGSALERLSHHLAGLVDMGFKLATGQVEVLKPSGVALLEQLVRLFAGVEDPLLEGARLMEQYQAQLVSALRAALAAGVAPTLSIAGGSLATTFLESGLAAGDSQVMRRLMDMLSAPLVVASDPGDANDSLWSDSSSSAGARYAEWVGVRARVALLQAQAQCSGIAQRCGNELTVSVVERAQRPLQPRLTALWAGLLQDHAVLTSQHPVVLRSYQQSRLLGPCVSPAVAAAVRPIYSLAWPSTLDALTVGLPPAARLQVLQAAPSAAEAQDQGRDAWRQYEQLLDIMLLLLADSGTELAVAVQVDNDGRLAAEAAARVLTCLRAFKSLTAKEYLVDDLVPPLVIAGLLDALSALAAHALLPLVSAERQAGGAATQRGSRPPAETACAHSHLAVPIIQGVSELLRDVGTSLPPLQLASPLSDCKEGVQEALHDSLAGTMMECILCYTSLVVPYAVKEGGGSVLPFVPWDVSTGLSGGAGPEPSASGRTNASPAALDSCLVGLLVAQQYTLRRAPRAVLAALAPAALDLGLRLLSCAPPGTPLTAGQRFFEGAISLILERLCGSDGGEGGIDQDASAAAVVLSVATSVSTLVELWFEGCAAGCSTDMGGRGPALLSASLLGASLLPCTPTTAAGRLAGAARQHLLSALEPCLQLNIHEPEAWTPQLQVLKAVTTALQSGAADSAQGGRRAWAMQCLGALGPKVAALARSSIACGTRHKGAAHSAWAAHCSAAAQEALLCLVRGTAVAASQGQQSAESVMRVAVPLLAEAACSDDLSLRSMAVATVMQLSSPSAGDTGAAFRTALTVLPVALKQRLQAALHASTAEAKAMASTGHPGASGHGALPASNTLPLAGSVAPSRPTIVLKTNFGVPARP